MDDGVLAEGGHGEEVVQRVPLRVPEPAGAVAPHPGAQDGRHGFAAVAVLGQAAAAVIALAHDRRQHRVAGGEALHVLTDALHHPANKLFAGARVGGAAPYAVSNR